MIDLYIKPLVKDFDPYDVIEWQHSFIKYFKLDLYDLYKGAQFVDPKYRDASYNVDRILYFYHLILNNKLINPISILVYDYEITIYDGYHRLAAHLLANKEIIQAEIK